LNIFIGFAIIDYKGLVLICQYPSC